MLLEQEKSAQDIQPFQVLPYKSHIGFYLYDTGMKSEGLRMHWSSALCACLRYCGSMEVIGLSLQSIRSLSRRFAGNAGADEANAQCTPGNKLLLAQRQGTYGIHPDAGDV